MKNQPLHPHTEIINKKQKNISKAKRQEALAWLFRRFPHAFSSDTAIYPLKTGILKDILLHAEEAQAIGVSRSKLREALVLYTRRIEYLACLKAQDTRIDLDGKPTAKVTEDEAQKAAIKLRRRVEKSTKNTKPLEPKEKAQILSPQYADKAALTSKVTIKHKTTRAYDPSTVARLKEKLGIPKPAEAKEADPI